jgi:hypothetical protein
MPGLNPLNWGISLEPETAKYLRFMNEGIDLNNKAHELIKAKSVLQRPSHYFRSASKSRLTRLVRMISESQRPTATLLTSI